MIINVKNQERFTDVALLYSKYRPSYPNTLIDYLVSSVGILKGNVVADIGSGTGIFSKILLEIGCYVYCVEPNDAMRQQAERFLLGSEMKNFTLIKASAEHTGIQEDSIDYITVAQAFHWFDKKLFKNECKRIMKNNSKIAIIWNMRDFNTDLVNSEYELRQKYCIGTQNLRQKDMDKRYVNDFFRNNEYDVSIFRNDIVLSREAYIGMNLSGSFSPNEKVHKDKFHDLVSELNRFFDKYSSNELINFPQFTECYVGGL